MCKRQIIVHSTPVPINNMIQHDYLFGEISTKISDALMPVFTDVSNADVPAFSTSA